MSDTTAFLLACIVQAALAGALAAILNYLSQQLGLGGKMSIAAGPLPLVFLALALWMIFGMGRVTYIGAMVIVACLFTAIILLPIGLIAAYFSLRFLKMHGAK